VDPSENTSTTRLRALVEALNKLKASPQDIIDIIKSLERSGDLYGRLVVE
jgi:flagellar basal body P-ring protein FlgI